LFLTLTKVTYILLLALRWFGGWTEAGPGRRGKESFVGFLTTLILVLAFLWMLQIVGTWYQMRHYRNVLGEITRSGGQGYVGVGNARARLGKGVILILVVDEGGVVRRALKMRGRTVFARFHEDPELLGMHVDELRAGDNGTLDASTNIAAKRAVEQIDRIKAEKAGAAAVR
jgi:glucitol operon activator protein